MKLGFKDYTIAILTALVILLTYMNWNGSDEPIEDVTIVTQDQSGSVTNDVEEVVKDTVTIEIEVPGNPLPAIKEIVVDSTYKAQYETAMKENDSLKAKNLFLESISLNTWKGTIVDDDDIRIDGSFRTRGTLLGYDIDYTIKGDTITYTPEVVTRFPKLSIVGGVKAHLPSVQGSQADPMVSAHIGIRGKKGNTFSVGYDSFKNVTFGYEWTIFRSKK